ncbi:MAG: hypothetical protein J7J17_03970 [Hadesarchaea archaeon]|nr:hypothetical protein [Hadesarchaea archaeon]
MAEETISEIFSEKGVATCVIVSVFLLWVALLIWTFGESDTATYAMNVFKCTGGALLSMALIGGGVVGRRKEKSVRVTLIVMGTIVLLALVSCIGISL